MLNCPVIIFESANPPKNAAQPGGKEVLFTRSVDLLCSALKTIGFSQLFLVSTALSSPYATTIDPNNLVGLIENNSASHFLVLSATMPMVFFDDLKESFNILQKSRDSILLFSDGDTGIGWYPKSILTTLIKTSNSHSASLTSPSLTASKVGVNSGFFLSTETGIEHNRLNTFAQSLVIERFLNSGVNIPISDGVMISFDCQIGEGTTVLPGTILKNGAQIGSDCVIGPNSSIDNSTVGNNCTITSSYVEDSHLKDRVKIGPMSHIRPNSSVGDDVKIGNFVEIKNTTLGSKTSVSHLTYVGDSDVGSGCNFGCGVVTVNYDGTAKHRSIIGNDVFIGCNSNLLSPITLDDGVYVAAGTTITESVPKDSLVIGRVRQTVKEGWRASRKLFEKKEL